MTSQWCDVAGPATPDVCALCGMTGKPVDRVTVEALVRPDLRAVVADTQYYFLEMPGCDVVYFAQDPPDYFFTADHGINLVWIYPRGRQIGLKLPSRRAECGS